MILYRNQSSLPAVYGRNMQAKGKMALPRGRKKWSQETSLSVLKKFGNSSGEVLGLLGNNGAGKSTIFKMITRDTNPRAGQVILNGSHGGDALGFLGCCPQENALWPSLPVQVHLKVFAAVKGLRKADTTAAITCLVDALKLQDQLKLPMKALLEGIKRKLCFALSNLGNLSVVLLDKPSMSMDPEGWQQTWQAMQATFRNTERGALLTTHYMAEAKAMCDRVAILVSGRLRHSSLMVYKLPVEDVRPLSQAFFKLKTVKQSFDLEEYSLSQSALEQVFLELSKEQKLEDFDEKTDLPVKWKLLPQEEP